MSRPVGIGVGAAGRVLLALLLWASMNRDAAGIPHVVRRMLAGEVLYADANPPLAFLLGLPPVWLADILGVPPAWRGRARC